MTTAAEAYFLDSPGGPLARRAIELAPPGPGEVLVAVGACGLCHTDLGFASGSVPTRHPLPLVLGHEVMGTVTAAGEGQAHLLGRPVLVPAVLPCGDCPFCRAGRGNACPRQRMPGNDVHGGFATHMLVPGAPLVPLDDAPGELDLRRLCVVADAVSTAWQALRRSGAGEGDAVVVVGAGGVGGFAIQVAHALGAHVLACDVQGERLRLMALHGAERTLAVGSVGPKEVRREVKAWLEGLGLATLRLRVLETSGTPEGQLLAYGLLAPAATLVQVGYTPHTVELRLSNLMAFDATVHGTWGCPPQAYPEVLGLIYRRLVALDPFVEEAPMSRLNELLGDMAAHRLTRRMVLDPRR
ncbi:MAG: 6-hydroxycyclohex-1-ene-1-carbonyl-CoA dehydrogenase [Planctomycetes bacterium]|nr:6-hydroxycyclohex-1-ene-1-carbonyl-CoA dehydrogenase [Planctomycetota bacterium]